MFKNFIKVAIRNLRRSKAFNLVNIAGLAIGLASSIFIIMYIVNEVNYDRFHSQGKQIYRLNLDGKFAGEEIRGAWNSPVFGPTFYEDVPEIVQFCRLDAGHNDLLWIDPGEKHLEEHILYADSTFFDVFSFALMEGDPTTCLKEPNSILLTEESASRYFKGEQAIGKTIYLNEEDNIYTVTGIVQNAPENSHLFYDFIISYCTMESSRENNFFHNNMFTYYVLDAYADPQVTEDKINASLLEHIRPLLPQFLGITVEEFEASGNKYGLKLQHLYDIHLNPGIALPSDSIYRPIGTGCISTSSG